MTDEQLPPINDGDEIEQGNPTTSGNIADPAPPSPADEAVGPDDLRPRLERLGGEPAPDITPEEFARLQQAGQIHIDPRGRVRTTARDETDAGISLRKRRAWYAG